MKYYKSPKAAVMGIPSKLGSSAFPVTPLQATIFKRSFVHVLAAVQVAAKQIGATVRVQQPLDEARTSRYIHVSQGGRLLVVRFADHKVGRTRQHLAAQEVDFWSTSVVHDVKPIMAAVTGFAL